MFSMEVPGSNAGKFFSTFFMHLFLSRGNCSIRIFQPRGLQLFGVCLVTL